MDYLSLPGSRGGGPNSLKKEWFALDFARKMWISRIVESEVYTQAHLPHKILQELDAGWNYWMWQCVWELGQWAWGRMSGIGVWESENIPLWNLDVTAWVMVKCFKEGVTWPALYFVSKSEWLNISKLYLAYIVCSLWVLCSPVLCHHFSGTQTEKAASLWYSGSLVTERKKGTLKTMGLYTKFILEMTCLCYIYSHFTGKVNHVATQVCDSMYIILSQGKQPCGQGGSKYFEQEFSLLQKTIFGHILDMRERH